MKIYDVIVIGMGPAGMAASTTASNFGLKVLAIESNKIGGECLNCGCIPSKAILNVAALKDDIDNISEFGLKINGSLDIKDVFLPIQNRIDTIGQKKAEKVFENVDRLIGVQAEFIDSHTIKAGNNLYYASKAIFIATGSKPFIPNIKGIERIDYLTNKNIFKINEIPERLVIIGGGAIASEMALSFKVLGSKQVSMINMDEHLIPSVDKDVAEVLEEQFLKRGIEVHNNTIATSVYKDGNTIVVNTTNGMLKCDKILVAAGRVPNIDRLALEKANVHYSKKGIIVDEFNRTNEKHIYAVGDCNGINLFSHAAMHQGMLSVMHLLGTDSPCNLKRSIYPVPWAIFTFPEIAHVGATEKQLEKEGIKFSIVKDYFKNYGRSLVDLKDEGFVKIMVDDRGYVLGASIVGNHASELIAEWTMAIQNHITIMDVAMMQHAFPTLSMMNLRVAQMAMMQFYANKGTLPQTA
ncbi:dihydrolipoyl dehydrogenase family protein [Hippea jasoniae]|uniref:dihydrolipoyl dehydrogenase family protein n=1 Tax=Hippea jasoniae TaxID=944479 RepID=UPI000552802B|nr:NAD(P)/FAD-dependent oxidoreductase [Hippea jasoniae]